MRVQTWRLRALYMLGFSPDQGVIAHIAEVTVNSFAGNGQYIV